jgi:hypothetical protein
MTSKEFVIWLKGFVTASNNYNLTPAAWDQLKKKLETVDDSIPMGGILSDNNTFKVHNDLGYFVTTTTNDKLNERTTNDMP